MKKYYRFTKQKIRKVNLKEIVFNPNESPKQKALAVAIGVFIGVLPIWGIQIASAIVSAQYFKLNKPLAVLGSYINLTPFFPLIIFFSLKIGFLLTGQTDAIPALSEISFQTAKTYFWLFLLGSVPMALLASIIFGSITYSAAKLLSLNSPIKTA